MRKCRKSISLHFLILSPFPLHFLILSPFPHSLSISSQPGCQDATICASLKWSISFQTFGVNLVALGVLSNVQYLIDLSLVQDSVFLCFLICIYVCESMFAQLMGFGVWRVCKYDYCSWIVCNMSIPLKEYASIWRGSILTAPGTRKPPCPKPTLSGEYFFSLWYISGKNAGQEWAIKQRTNVKGADGAELAGVHH